MLQLMITMVGAVALLLWGTHMVQTSVQRSVGPKLRGVLGRALHNRGYGFCTGLGVTAVLQSSTATGLMISGFAADGMVALAPALSVMLGANVGTTLIVQILSFDISAFGPILILVGVVLFRRYRMTRLRDISRMFIGLGLMLLALRHLLDAVTLYEGAPGLHLLLGLVAAVPLLAMLLGVTLAWMAHSSVAIILVVVSLASKGAIAPDTAFALVLGANLGTAINPVIEGISGSCLANTRVPLGNLLARVAGVLLALACLGPVTRWFVVFEPDIGRAVADYHTAFNIILALFFLPFLHPYARLLVRLFPVRAVVADPSRPAYLDPAAAQTPILALGAAAREVLRLTNMLDEMLAKAGESLADDNRHGIAENKKLGQSLRSLSAAIQAYLATLDLDGLSAADRQRLKAIFAFAGNISCAIGAVNKGLQSLTAKRLESGLSLDTSDRSYLETAFERVRSNLRSAAALLVTDDPRGAQLLADEKRVFRKLEDMAGRSRFEHLRSGVVDSSFRLDLIRELKRVNAHLVAGASYRILEQ